MKIELFRRALVLVALVSLPAAAAEPLTLGSLFTDHAVLQRDMAVPVWGKAEPGRQVVVQFAGQEKRATADKDGRWTVKLDPMPLRPKGGRSPSRPTRTARRSTAQDVLVGEVWVCSGQSNMWWTVGLSNYGQATIAAAGDPQLRLFNASPRATDAPQESIGGQWLRRCAGQRARIFGRGLLFRTGAAARSESARRLDRIGRRRNRGRSLDATG